MAPPLNRLPREGTQSEFGVQGADLIGVMDALLLQTVELQFTAYRADSRTDTGTLPPVAAQSQIHFGVAWSGARNGCDATGIVPN